MRESTEHTDSVGLNISELLSGSIHRMSHVYRYSSVPVIRRENVAEHSWYVAFYAFLIGQDLVQHGHVVDFGKMLSRALVHDLDESSTGDFLRHIKYGHPDLKRALDEVSISMIGRIESKLRSNGREIMVNWQSAKDDDLEGHVIQVVDLARVITYVWEEIKLGNTHVCAIMGECCDYLREFCRDHEGSPLVPYAIKIINWAIDKGA